MAKITSSKEDKKKVLEFFKQYKSVTFLPEKAGFCDSCGAELAEDNESVFFLCPECEAKMDKCDVCGEKRKGSNSWSVDIGGNEAMMCGNCYAGVCKKCGKPNRHHGFSFDETAQVLSFVCEDVKGKEEELRRERNERKRERRAWRG